VITVYIINKYKCNAVQKTNNPILKEHQFALLVADGATGHIYNTDFELFINDGKETYFIFNSFEAAKDFVLALSNVNAAYEYAIYNGKYELVEHILAKKWWK